MEVKINSVHFNADQRLVEFVNKKVNKLDTFFEGIINAEVTLKVLKPEAANNKISELKISIPTNGYLFAKKQAATFEEATDLAVDAIRKQLGKYKEKLKSK
ncbi:MAG: ribosome-associated translation inhibitor RaiA [Prolixibacteraceae bacterium]|jgi:putative sigma-54 modulation protein|nr:ribosome-associated translation inhibitor RaiA [Prolixibacteraceae bacterium]MBT6005112.1 ribosome-associated translation inhibitor RaiA [Prolixibacteraceae bacterium]MBT6763748.1 ribosome-associated translation inhibitor RaiA [Prolixibacteraceae bacterium]MBT7000656.1 ribosome-associated translation inhibitor RaiA [Prolixibacteraceae bacterium]MBT7397372.1 ribosome-associated translation inhibitor RaiA [Prolixibacteraceae bacterium]